MFRNAPERKAAGEESGGGGGGEVDEEHGTLLLQTPPTAQSNHYCHSLRYSADHPPSHPHQYLHHHHRFEPRHQHENSINERHHRMLQQQQQQQRQQHLVAAKDPENGLCPPSSFLHPQHGLMPQQHPSRPYPYHHHSPPHHRVGLLPKNKRRHRWLTSCFGDKNTNNNTGKVGGGMAFSLEQARLVDKDGECIIRPTHLRGSFNICLRNWFHLVIEHSWRRIFSLFAGGFLCSWLGFGLLYYLIQHFSGDLQNLSEQHKCIANVHSLTSAFLFSLESQHTIGYGTRYMTEACPIAYAVLSLQCIVGVLLQTILSGIVIAKILRPKKRKQEMRFSKYAVIGPVSEEDQRPALMIRLADIQHRLYIAESHVRLYMATTKINKRGECELLGVQDMNVGYDTGMDRVLLLWPVVIRHIIDEDSPLWEITEDKLKTCQFELIMTVEGIVEATGMAFQARTSFMPYEILWGRHFVPLITLNSSSNHYEVDYDLFDVTEPQPVEPWLPEEEEQEENDLDEGGEQQQAQDEQQQQRGETVEECIAANVATKLSIISELEAAAANNRKPLNGYLLEQPLPQQQPHHYQKNRRKSTCSIAESIRSMSSAGAGSAGGIVNSNNNNNNNNRFKTHSVSMAMTGTGATAADDTVADDQQQQQPQMVPMAMRHPENNTRLPVAAPRKNSRSSLLHLLLRRTQTNDSSPLMATTNKCVGNTAAGADNELRDESDEEGEEGGDVENGGRLNSSNSSTTLLHPPPPASPFVVHTLQHSGFT